MLKKFAFLGFFIVSFFFHESFIFAAGNACSMPSYLIVHINGINTTKKEARYNALQVLAEAVGSSYKGERVEVAIAYNPTKALLDDLSDVFAQKMKEYPEVGRDLIFKALVNGVVSPLLPLQLKEYTAKYHIGKVESSGFVGYSDEDLGDIVSAIRAK